MRGDFQALDYVTARKKHICWHSGKPIEPGNKYYRMTGKYEGEMYSLPLHKDHETILDSAHQKPKILALKAKSERISENA